MSKFDFLWRRNSLEAERDACLERNGGEAGRIGPRLAICAPSAKSSPLDNWRPLLSKLGATGASWRILIARLARSAYLGEFGPRGAKI